MHIPNVISILILIAGRASANHFRYATLSYESVGGNSVHLLVWSQFRRSYSTLSVFAGSGSDGRAVIGDVIDMVGVDYSSVGGDTGPIRLFTGDGAAYPLKLTVTAYSAEDDYVYGWSRVAHTYGAPNDGGNDWLAYLEGCCRDAFGGGDFKVTARVNLAAETDSLVVKSLPEVTVGDDHAAFAVTILANSPSGAVPAAWRLGQGSEVGTAAALPAGAVAFAAGGSAAGGGGVLLVNGSALGPGWYAVVVQVGSAGRAVAPVDFRIRVVPGWGRAGGPPPPVFVGDAVATNRTLRGQARVPRLDGFVGYPVFFTLRAATARPGARVADIRVFILPVGATLSNRVESGSPGNHTLSVDFSWIPAGGQGHVHYVCMEAVDAPWSSSSSSFAPAAAGNGSNGTGWARLSSGQHCLAIVNSPDNPPPRFDSPPANSTLRLYMGVPNSVRISGASDNPYDALVLQPLEPLLYAQALSPPVYTEKRMRATDSAAQVSAAATFSWRPATNMGGYRQDLCFRLSQLGGPGAAGGSAARCFVVEVLRCRYLAQPGDTLRSVAAAFQMDWLGLWGLNVDLPTFDLRPGAEVAVGRLYTVQEGDTLATIAREMAMAQPALRSLNHDFASAGGDTRLAGGARLCVLPNTCAPD